MMKLVGFTLLAQVILLLLASVSCDDSLSPEFRGEPGRKATQEDRDNVERFFEARLLQETRGRNLGASASGSSVHLLTLPENFPLWPQDESIQRYSWDPTSPQGVYPPFNDEGGYYQFRIANKTALQATNMTFNVYGNKGMSLIMKFRFVLEPSFYEQIFLCDRFPISTNRMQAFRDTTYDRSAIWLYPGYRPEQYWIYQGSQPQDEWTTLGAYLVGETLWLYKVGDDPITRPQPLRDGVTPVQTGMNCTLGMGTYRANLDFMVFYMLDKPLPQKDFEALLNQVALYGQKRPPPPPPIELVKNLEPPPSETSATCPTPPLDSIVYEPCSIDGVGVTIDVNSTGAFYVWMKTYGRNVRCRTTVQASPGLYLKLELRCLRLGPPGDTLNIGWTERGTVDAYATGGLTGALDGGEVAAENVVELDFVSDGRIQMDGFLLYFEATGAPSPPPSPAPSPPPAPVAHLFTFPDRVAYPPDFLERTPFATQTAAYDSVGGHYVLEKGTGSILSVDTKLYFSVFNGISITMKVLLPESLDDSINLLEVTSGDSTLLAVRRDAGSYTVYATIFGERYDMAAPPADGLYHGLGLYLIDSTMHVFLEAGFVGAYGNLPQTVDSLTAEYGNVTVGRDSTFKLLGVTFSDSPLEMPDYENQLYTTLNRMDLATVKSYPQRFTFPETFDLGPTNYQRMYYNRKLVGAEEDGIATFSGLDGYFEIGPVDLNFGPNSGFTVIISFTITNYLSLGRLFECASGIDSVDNANFYMTQLSVATDGQLAAFAGFDNGGWPMTKKAEIGERNTFAMRVMGQTMNLFVNPIGIDGVDVAFSASGSRQNFYCRVGRGFLGGAFDRSTPMSSPGWFFYGAPLSNDEIARLMFEMNGLPQLSNSFTPLPEPPATAVRRIALPQDAPSPVEPTPHVDATWETATSISTNFGKTAALYNPDSGAVEFRTSVQISQPAAFAIGTNKGFALTTQFRLNGTPAEFENLFEIGSVTPDLNVKLVRFSDEENFIVVFGEGGAGTDVPSGDNFGLIAVPQNAWVSLTMRCYFQDQVLDTDGTTIVSDATAPCDFTVSSDASTTATTTYQDPAILLDRSDGRLILGDAFSNPLAAYNYTEIPVASMDMSSFVFYDTPYLFPVKRFALPMGANLRGDAGNIASIPFESDAALLADHGFTNGSYNSVTGYYELRSSSFLTAPVTLSTGTRKGFTIVARLRWTDPPTPWEALLEFGTFGGGGDVNEPKIHSDMLNFMIARVDDTGDFALFYGTGDFYDLTRDDTGYPAGVSIPQNDWVNLAIRCDDGGDSALCDIYVDFTALYLDIPLPRGILQDRVGERILIGESMNKWFGFVGTPAAHLDILSFAFYDTALDDFEFFNIYTDIMEFNDKTIPAPPPLLRFAPPPPVCPGGRGFIGSGCTQEEFDAPMEMLSTYSTRIQSSDEGIKGAARFGLDLIVHFDLQHQRSADLTTDVVTLTLTFVNKTSSQFKTLISSSALTVPARAAGFELTQVQSHTDLYTNEFFVTARLSTPNVQFAGCVAFRAWVVGPRQIQLDVVSLPVRELTFNRFTETYAPFEIHLYESMSVLAIFTNEKVRTIDLHTLTLSTAAADPQNRLAQNPLSPVYLLDASICRNRADNDTERVCVGDVGFLYFYVKDSVPVFVYFKAQWVGNVYTNVILDYDINWFVNTTVWPFNLYDESKSATTPFVPVGKSVLMRSVCDPIQRLMQVQYLDLRGPRGAMWTPTDYGDVGLHYCDIQAVQSAFAGISDGVRLATSIIVVAKRASGSFTMYSTNNYYEWYPEPGLGRKTSTSVDEYPSVQDLVGIEPVLLPQNGSALFFTKWVDVSDGKGSTFYLSYAVSAPRVYGDLKYLNNTNTPRVFNTDNTFIHGDRLVSFLTFTVQNQLSDILTIADLLNFTNHDRYVTISQSYWPAVLGEIELLASDDQEAIVVLSSGTVITLDMSAKCLPGFVCPGKTGAGYGGDINWGLTCPQGFFCPGDRTQIQCDAGQYCPAGSAEPETCTESGIECTGSSRHICPRGYRCVNGQSAACSSSQLCPAGSIEAQQCPAGYLCNGASAYPCGAIGSKCSIGGSGSPFLLLNRFNAVLLDTVDTGLTVDVGGSGSSVSTFSVDDRAEGLRLLAETDAAPLIQINGTTMHGILLIDYTLILEPSAAAQAFARLNVSFLHTTARGGLPKRFYTSLSSASLAALGSASQVAALRDLVRNTSVANFDLSIVHTESLFLISWLPSWNATNGDGSRDTWLLTFAATVGVTNVSDIQVTTLTKSIATIAASQPKPDLLVFTLLNMVAYVRLPVVSLIGVFNATGLPGYTDLALPAAVSDGTYDMTLFSATTEHVILLMANGAAFYSSSVNVRTRAQDSILPVDLGPALEGESGLIERHPTFPRASLAQEYAIFTWCRKNDPLVLEAVYNVLTGALAYDVLDMYPTGKGSKNGRCQNTALKTMVVDSIISTLALGTDATGASTDCQALIQFDPMTASFNATYYTVEVAAQPSAYVDGSASYFSMSDAAIIVAADDVGNREQMMIVRGSTLAVAQFPYGLFTSPQNSWTVVEPRLIGLAPAILGNETGVNLHLFDTSEMSGILSSIFLPTGSLNDTSSRRRLLQTTSGPELSLSTGFGGVAALLPNGTLVTMQQAPICLGGFNCGTSSSAVGYLCDRGSVCPEGQPVRQCQNGEYCPEGISEAQSCPTGKLCVQGLDYSCPSGKFCIGGIETGECPTGTYCPSNTTSAEVTPAGVYDLDGEVYVCPPKYYCTGGTAEPRACPKGFYCPMGSRAPVVCPPSTYCPDGLHAIPLLCPKNSYCEGGIERKSCPRDFVSPYGSPSETFCVTSGIRPLIIAYSVSFGAIFSFFIIYKLYRSYDYIQQRSSEETALVRGERLDESVEHGSLRVRIGRFFTRVTRWFVSLKRLVTFNEAETQKVVQAVKKVVKKNSMKELHEEPGEVKPKAKRAQSRWRHFTFWKEWALSLLLVVDLITDLINLITINTRACNFNQYLDPNTPGIKVHWYGETDGKDIGGGGGIPGQGSGFQNYYLNLRHCTDLTCVTGPDNHVRCSNQGFFDAGLLSSTATCPAAQIPLSQKDIQSPIASVSCLFFREVPFLRLLEGGNLGLDYFHKNVSVADAYGRRNELICLANGARHKAPNLFSGSKNTTQPFGSPFVQYWTTKIQPQGSALVYQSPSGFEGPLFERGYAYEHYMNGTINENTTAPAVPVSECLNKNTAQIIIDAGLFNVSAPLKFQDAYQFELYPDLIFQDRANQASISKDRSEKLRQAASALMWVLIAKEIVKAVGFAIMYSFERTRNRTSIQFFVKHIFASLVLPLAPSGFVFRYYLNNGDQIGEDDEEDVPILQHLLDVLLEDGPQLAITVGWIAVSQSVGDPINAISLWFTLAFFIYTAWLVLEKSIQKTFDAMARTAQAKMLRRFTYVMFHGNDVESAQAIGRDQKFEVVLRALHGKARNTAEVLEEEEEKKKWIDWESEKTRRGGYFTGKVLHEMLEIPEAPKDARRFRFGNLAAYGMGSRHARDLFRGTSISRRRSEGTALSSMDSGQSPRDPSGAGGQFGTKATRPVLNRLSPVPDGGHLEGELAVIDDRVPQLVLPVRDGRAGSPASDDLDRDPMLQDPAPPKERELRDSKDGRIYPLPSTVLLTSHESGGSRGSREMGRPGSGLGSNRGSARVSPSVSTLEIDSDARP